VKKDKFYRKQSEQSKLKMEIVIEYFNAWSRIMLAVAKRNRRESEHKIAYIDLFAGQGLFEDGMPSTPLKVLQIATEDSAVGSHLVTLFNDKDKKAIQKLGTEIGKIRGINSLKYPPKLLSGEVGDIHAQTFEKMKLVPTLLFLDPWGYRGVSLHLIWSVLKDWGCDCIFFFNYNRVQAALFNNTVRQRVDALFGKQRADGLRGLLKSISKTERESEIMRELVSAIKENGGRFVSKLRFLKSGGRGTSHYLVFVSKDFKGLEKMRPILARRSTSVTNGVPSFVFDPSARRDQIPIVLGDPLETLAKTLLVDFKGQEISADEMYRAHCPASGQEYLRANYTRAIVFLLERGQVSVLDDLRCSTKRTPCRITSKTVVLFP
jgi:three-Cys-motif partner protein